MILDAIEMSRMVKCARPDLSVIFGAWHPSLKSGKTLLEDFVDVVVRHNSVLGKPLVRPVRLEEV